jgi:hypothetical protein
VYDGRAPITGRTIRARIWSTRLCKIRE